MIPIKDNIRSWSFPLVNWLLIAANAVVFFYEIRLSPAGLEQFFSHFALIPAQLQLTNPLTYPPLFTHMFLHGGWLHILSNMWILYIFGDNVEDRLGSRRYLLFYLLGGLAAGLLQAQINPNSPVPLVGASGAIAAVLGAYFLYYPAAKVITFVPIFFFGWFIEVSAYIYLGFWFLTQLYPGLTSINAASGANAGGIAWWAHIGGFLFGLLLARPFAARKPRQVTYPDQYWPW